jgi:hypothetical protein
MASVEGRRSRKVEQRTENPRVGGSIDCESANADSCPSGGFAVLVRFAN